MAANAARATDPMRATTASGSPAQGTGLVPRYSAEVSSHFAAYETMRGWPAGISEKSISCSGKRSMSPSCRPSIET